MGVPAHDARDFAFATRMGVPIKTVVEADASVNDSDNDGDGETQLFEDLGRVVNSGTAFDGLDSAAAIDAIGKALEETGHGGPTTQYKLRDWLVSRQRCVVLCFV